MKEAQISIGVLGGDDLNDVALGRGRMPLVMLWSAGLVELGK